MKPSELIDKLADRYRNTDIDWEMLLEHAYRSFLDRDCWALDIGGHAARHAEVLSAAVGCARVEIVEPLPDYAGALRKRYAKNARIRVHECAVGAQPGTASFVFNAGSPEESGLRERVYNVPEAKHLIEIEVEVRCLDALCADFERLDFVKIDTEGGEMDILEAGRDTLERFRPILSVEYGASSYEAYGKKQIDLYEFAEDLRYRLCDLFGTPFLSAEDWAGGCDRYYWDYLMVPLERFEQTREHLAGQLARVAPGILD
jgi:FkbM family methyltransferase